MKTKSYKITKLEKNRKSILTDNLDNCYICGTYPTQLHEIFFGKNRVNSMKYGCVVPLCMHCHHKVHHDYNLDIQLKKACEWAFIEVYECDIDEFINIFHKNYL